MSAKTLFAKLVLTPQTSFDCDSRNRVFTVVAHDRPNLSDIIAPFRAALRGAEGGRGTQITGGLVAFLVDHYKSLLTARWCSNSVLTGGASHIFTMGIALPTHGFPTIPVAILVVFTRTPRIAAGCVCARYGVGGVLS